jgi:hypothetical protein
MRTWSFLTAMLFIVSLLCACSSDGDDNDGASDDDDDDDDNDDTAGDDDDDNDDDNDDDDDDDNDSTPYPPEYCAYFLTGEVDLVGIDADQDGSPNGWDQCPNNPADWLDSDRDGIGNASDPDLDGDGIPNAEDADQDGDGFDDSAEATAGTDPKDPSSIPGLRRFDLDLGVMNPSPGWYMGDLHIHTEYSHDSRARLAWYLGPAQEAGYDFLAITDHDVFEAPFDPAWDQDDLLLIPGIEWGGAGGHANMWGIRTLNDAASNDPDDIRQSWRLAKLQGGVQSLNHYGSDEEDWDALFAAAPDLFAELDVIEVWNIFWLFNGATNLPSIELWEQLLSEGYRIGAVGGGDAHYVPALHLGPTTVVWAESLSVPGILDGIRRGRTYVTQGDFLVFTGRPELDFRVDADGDGIFEAMLGDEVPAGPIELQINIRKAKGVVRLIRNGTVIASFADHEPGSTITHTVEDDAPSGAWYRVEMRDSAWPSSAMRLFSSAIYVAP